MYEIVGAAQAEMVERDIQRLDLKHLPHWIEGLREAETKVRHLRKRLEALQDPLAPTCPGCGRVVSGRADARYCSTNCRVTAHRRSKRDDEPTNTDSIIRQRG
jgi:hypothetical protein